MVNCRALASSQLMDSMGLRPGPGVSPNTPSQNLGNVVIILVWAQNIWVSFLPLPPLLFISPSPWSLGPGGTVLTYRVTPLPPFLLPVVLKSCCQGGGGGAMYLSSFSVLQTAVS